MNHKEPVPLIIMQGDTPFYACPRYFRKDDEHPDGHEADDKMCLNRLSFTKAQSIVDKMMKVVENDRANGIFTADYKGYTFTVSGIEVTVLKYHFGAGIKFGILNRSAIHP